MIETNGEIYHMLTETNSRHFPLTSESHTCPMLIGNGSKQFFLACVVPQSEHGTITDEHKIQSKPARNTITHLQSDSCIRNLSKQCHRLSGAPHYGYGRKEWENIVATFTICSVACQPTWSASHWRLTSRFIGYCDCSIPIQWDTVVRI